MDLDDPTLRDRLIAARVARDEAAEAVRQFVDRPVGGPAVITPARVQRLAAVLRDCLRTGDMGLRKSYLRMFLDQVVVVAAEIRLRGPTAALAAAANSGELSPAGMVPSFVRKWRPVGESNPRYRRERAVSWASRRTGPSRSAFYGLPPTTSSHRRTAHRASIARPSTWPSRRSSTTTRSGPPPCNRSASRSPNAEIPAIRVPAGSSNTASFATGGAPDPRRATITPSVTDPATITTPIATTTTTSSPRIRRPST